MTFTSSNDIDSLCASIESRDDSIVEDPMSTTLQLQIGVVNDRISIEPPNAVVMILDDDSTFMGSCWPKKLSAKALCLFPKLQCKFQPPLRGYLPKTATFGDLPRVTIVDRFLSIRAFF